MKLNHKFITVTILMVTLVAFTPKKTERILIFSKTTGFRHASIEIGQEAIKKMGNENNFEVIITEDPEYFNKKTLKEFSAVVFLNTTGEILDDGQQSHFERYIQKGGGFVGIHSATDTENKWPWYNKLVGAYFAGHPPIQKAILKVVDKSHPSTSMLPDEWIRIDEWYIFKDVNPDLNILIKMDVSSLKKGDVEDDDYALSWYHEFDGGRAFYTELGHTNESYSNALYLQHLLGGIQYAIGKN